MVGEREGSEGKREDLLSPGGDCNKKVEAAFNLICLSNSIFLLLPLERSR